ncbi:MAG: hypothetical protein QNK05_08135 [Myxococcota bacterium]|nr:hypothetical protein [Myxococcota bacterium]
MDREAPRLTFFVELESQALDAMMSRPEVLPFLAENRCALSMGLIDLSPERAAWVRELETNGVPVTAWLLLDVADGYWLNADNADVAVSRWRETREWAETAGLRLHRVGLDVEFPRSESKGVLRNRRAAVLDMFRRRRSREQVERAEAAYGALVEEIRATGRSVESYHFPYLLDERAAGSWILRRSLGLVDVAVDAEVFMLYATYLGRAGARAYFEDAPCIALGVTGGGVNQNEPEARSRHLRFEELEPELRAAAAHTRDVYVFSLEGCVEKGWLDRIAKIEWSEPAPPLPIGERISAARSRFFARSLFRAEPLWDRLFAAR